LLVLNFDNKDRPVTLSAKYLLYFHVTFLGELHPNGSKVIFMKSRSIFLLFLFISFVSFGQNFSLDFGVGTGASLGDGGIAPRNTRWRGLLFIGGYLHIGTKASIGIETSTSFPIRILFDDDGTRVVNDINVLNPAPNAANVVLAKGTIYLNKHKGSTPYLGLGVGSTTFVSQDRLAETNDGLTQRIKRTSLIIQPEIGLKFDNFLIALRYRYTGKTPGFDGVDPGFIPDRFLLESIRVSPFYITAAYSLKL